MKLHHRFIVLLSSSFLLFPSCNKEDIEQVADTYKAPEKIIFGETGNLDALVYKFDLPLILEPDSADGLMTFDIDLTSDEVDDIAFSVSDKLDPSTHIRLSAVYALNDSLQILLAVQADTNFISSSINFGHTCYG